MLLAGLLLGCLVPLGSAGAEEAYGGRERAEGEAARDLSPGATRVLQEAHRAIDRKEYEKAVRILERFIEKYPKQNHFLVEFTLANALYYAGDKEQSLARYRAAVEMNPEYGPAWVNLGQVAYDLERYGLAADALAKGFARTEKEQRNPDLLYYAAVAHILDENREKALPILEALVSGKYGEPDKEWYQALLNVYLNLNRLERAEGLLRQIMARYGSDPETWRLAYQLQVNRMNYKTAAVALTIYSYLKPLTRDEAILLGDLYAAIHVPLLASAHYERAFAAGASPEEYERLAAAYVSAHRPGEARQVLSEALEKSPSASLWSLVGDLNYMEEDYEGALFAFEESARLDPQEGRAYLMMGYCALEAGRKDQAHQALEKAEGFPGQRQPARQLLRSLD